jgi:hypothetical protein
MRNLRLVVMVLYPTVMFAMCHRAYAQDATQLEEQYKTCANHYIPADKCTDDIYRQLKAKDNAPVDPTVAKALVAVKEYQSKLRNPKSMQVRMAYVTTEKGLICLDISGQNGMGGMTSAKVVKAGNHWFDGTGILGGLTNDHGQVDMWGVGCTAGTFHPKLKPGTDVTDKVNEALAKELQ